MNNYERIKSMTIDEMSEYLYNSKAPCYFCTHRAKDYDCFNGDCKQGVKQWLSLEE